ncbi:MAG: restriction endonuclease [Xanthomonadaceae bacterium]|nr:restriction endonuclease [Xanthomonadaceae bacterium]
MSIPDYQTLLLPLLRLAVADKARTLIQAEQLLADEFALSEAERNARLPSGQQTVLRNRVGWASFYLTRAELLVKPKRGVFFTTDAGRRLVESGKRELSVEDLMTNPRFAEFYRSRSAPDTDATGETAVSERTPDEALQDAYEVLRKELAAELQDRLQRGSPAFFEQVVVDLLVAMGYGGSRQDAGERIGKSGDGGIDGIIKEDRLGLDTIYVQAKRWQGSVGRPDIQKFVGALQGQRARKGVFMTTSTFSSDARAYVTNIDTKVVLLDGDEIAELMIDHGVGVTPVATFIVKRIDSDYFEESQ